MYRVYECPVNVELAINNENKYRNGMDQCTTSGKHDIGKTRVKHDFSTQKRVRFGTIYFDEE